MQRLSHLANQPKCAQPSETMLSWNAKWFCWIRAYASYVRMNLGKILRQNYAHASCWSWGTMQLRYFIIMCYFCFNYAFRPTCPTTVICDGCIMVAFSKEIYSIFSCLCELHEMRRCKFVLLVVYDYRLLLMSARLYTIIQFISVAFQHFAIYFIISY